MIPSLRRRRPIDDAPPTVPDPAAVDPTVPRLRPLHQSDAITWIPLDSTWIGSPRVDPSTQPESTSRPDPAPADSPDSTRLVHRVASGPEAGAAAPTAAWPAEPTDSESRRRVDPSRPDPPNSVDPTQADSGRDWVVDLGLTIGGLAAIIASFKTLKDLAHLAGWGDLDWLLPLTLDTFVITATRVWLSRRTRSRKVRRFAMANAIGAIALSLAGNASYHAINAGAWHLGRYFWLLIVAVSSIPPLAIGLISHLAVLRGQDVVFAAAEQRAAASARLADSTHPTRPDSADPTLESITRPEPIREPTDPADQAPAAGDVLAPDPASESTRVDPGVDPTQEPADPTPEQDEPAEDVDPLLPRARELDAKHRQEKRKPIGAETLRRELGVGAKRARDLRDAVHGLQMINNDTYEETG